MNNNTLRYVEELLVGGRYDVYDKIIALIEKTPELVCERDEAGRTLLIICARFAGASSVLQRLIELGADPNQRAYDNSNALAAAISSGSKHGLTMEKEIRVLIEKGADPNAIADSGMPALHWAISQNRPDYIPLLLSYGANPNQLTSDTPMKKIRIMQSGHRFYFARSVH
jgi:ankyrin repeat protein